MREEETSSGCCEDSSKFEIEHTAYREISTVCHDECPIVSSECIGGKKRKKNVWLKL